MNKPIRIALAGNPNSGKTLLYNLLTGSTEQVGNWAGVTVEASKAPLKKGYASQPVEVLDLPGTYSISPFTPEEALARRNILDQDYDVLINVADGANLSRSLFLSTQLLELGRPMVIALNKADIIRKRGDEIDFSALEGRLGVPIIEVSASLRTGIETLVAQALKAKTQKREVKLPQEDSARKVLIDELIRESVVKQYDPSKVNLSDKLDRIFIHPIFGFVSFFLIMWAVYAFSIEGLGGLFSGFINDTLFGDILPGYIRVLQSDYGLHPVLADFLQHVILGGVGSVLGFIPIIMVLFFSLSLLEDSGYMSRVAVLMDRYFKRIGLSGKSIIPMIVGSGCAVPGVMATRTIENLKQRRITAMLTPFVPCSAKLPVIALFSVAFFPRASWVGPSTYLIAIFIIIAGGLLLKKILKNEEVSHFIVELPEYRVPQLRLAVERMWSQAKAFIYKASTIIFVMSALVWLMQGYGPQGMVEQADHSWLALITKRLDFLLFPLGIAGWQLFSALFTGFVAKENVVGTLAVLLGASDPESMQQVGSLLSGWFNPVTAYAFLLLNLFTPPCVAAISALRTELAERRWFWITLGFQLSVGYILAILTAQLGSLFVYKTLLPSWWIALIILLAYTILTVYLIGRKERHA